MKKICHFTSVHPWSDVRIFYKECQSIAKAGFETHLVVPGAPKKLINGVHMHDIKVSGYGRLKRMTRICWELYKKCRSINADIYHFHDPELIPVGIFLQSHNKKVIYDVHEDYPELILTKDWVDARLRRPLAYFTEVLENWASRRMDCLVVPTPFIANKFVKLGCKVVSIYNYPLKSEFSDRNNDLQNRKGVFCYVGVIKKTRGLFEMIEAVGRVGGKLLLAGEFESNTQRQQASEMPYWRHVEDLGYLTREEVSKTINRSMAGLAVLHPLVNYIHAFPTKIFEYMAAGIPVIGSNFPLCLDIIEGNRCGVCVDPLNIDEIVASLTWILSHPREAKIMGENGKKAVREKFNWGVEGRKLIDTYNELLA